MCWGAAAGVAVAVEVLRGFARFSLSGRCSKEGFKSLKSACGWDVCSKSLSAGVGNGRASDCLKVCRCCRSRTCNSLGMRGTCHRRRKRSHWPRLVSEGSRAARGIRLKKNFGMKSTCPACGVVTSKFLSDAEGFADLYGSVEGPSRGSSETVGLETSAMRRSRTTAGRARGASGQR